MSEGFIVRAATLGDCDGMRALLADADGLHRTNVPWMFHQPIAEPRPNAYFERLLDSEASTLLVAEGPAQLVGVAVALMRSAPDFAPVSAKLRKPFGAGS